jgi:hypothetical protein
MKIGLVMLKYFITVVLLFITTLDVYACTADFTNCMDPGSTAFVLTNQPSARTSTLDGASIQNEVPVIISRVQTGFYNVQLGQIASRGGNVQITAYDKNAHCQAVSWRRGIVNVKCFSPEAKPFDSRFLLLFKKDVWDKNLTLDYRHASDPKYASKSHYVAWGKEKSVPVSRRGTGSYFITFYTSTPKQASVQVTALGVDPAYCNVMDWSDRGISVQCFSIKDHQPIDSGFTMLLGSGDSVWLNNQKTPNPDNEVNIVRQSPGLYFVHLDDSILRTGGNAQVTAYGSDAHCNIKEMSSEGVLVSCFRGLEPSDSRFSLLYERRVHQTY